MALCKHNRESKRFSVVSFLGTFSCCQWNLSSFPTELNMYASKKAITFTVGGSVCVFLKIHYVKNCSCGE